MFTKPKFALVSTTYCPIDDKCINGAGIIDYVPGHEWEV